MRGRRSVTILTLFAALTAGCGGGGSGIAPNTAGTPAAQPAVSADGSMRALNDYVKRYNEAVGGDSSAWRGLASDALGAAASAQLRIGGGRPPRLPKISLTNPVFYVPRLSGSTAWFAVAALEHDGSARNPVFLLFTRSKSSGTWRAATRLYFRGDPPRIATDAQGYAVAIDPAAQVNPATTPAGLPVAQSTYLEFGDARSIAAGRFTSDWRKTEQRAEETMRAAGISATDRFAASGYPVYALRTTDGGALVFYALKRTETLVLTGGTGNSGLPADIRAYLNGQTGGQIIATWMWRTVAYLPTQGQASVIFQSMDLTAAHTSS